MKKLFLFFLIHFFAYSQSTGIAIYGIGENINNSDPNSISVGNSYFFSSNSKNISLSSPSSQWRSSLTRFTINSGMSFLTNQQYNNQFYHNLSSFSIHFPIGDKKVLGFGLQPLFRINNIEISDDEFKFIGSDQSTTGSAIALKNNYFINGGVSEFFLDYSQKISTSSFSLGIKYSFLFGNQYLNDELYMYNLKLDSVSLGLNILEIIDNNDTIYYNAQFGTLSSLKKYRKFSGNSLTMELRYTGKRNECAFKVIANSAIQVGTTNIQNVDGLIYTNYFNNISKPILYEIDFGYLNQISSRLFLSMEIHKRESYNIPVNSYLFDIPPPSELSFHLGSYYKLINSRVGFWNNINFASGAFIKELDFSGIKYIDYGITIGTGIEYLSNTQSVDIAFTFGEKESMIFTDHFEKYITCHIGFTTSEKWFMKRRRK